MTPIWIGRSGFCLGATSFLRIGRRCWLLKAPSAFACFSERYGYNRTLLRWRGWRILFRKDARP